MTFNKILADHDDVKSHGTIVYATASDPYHVYADTSCTVVIEGETLKDIYLKGCVVAAVDNGVVRGTYIKPVGFDGEKLVFSTGGGGGSVTARIVDDVLHIDNGGI